MTETFIAHLEIALRIQSFSNNNNNYHLDLQFIVPPSFPSAERFSQAVQMHQAWPILDCSRDRKADGERKRERGRQRGIQRKSQ